MTTRFARFLILEIFCSLVLSLLLVAIYLAATLGVLRHLLAAFFLCLLLWLLSPALNDFLFRYLYRLEFWSDEAFIERYPQLFSFIARLAAEHEIQLPRIGFIADECPVAFTYGSLPGNARLVLSSGLFQLLDREELEAVVARELGHSAHCDFPLLTLASTPGRILIELYFSLACRPRQGDGPLSILAALCRACSELISYPSLWFSRRCHDRADKFSALATGKPGSLSRALVKLAGAAPATSGRGRALAGSVRSLGILDPGMSGGWGMAPRLAQDPRSVGALLSFDLVSPWSIVLEFFSTHLLLGQRIERLDDLSAVMGREMVYDLPALIDSLPIDQKRLYAGFFPGLIVHSLPAAGLFLGLLDFLLSGSCAGMFFLCGLGIILRAPYRFPRSADRLARLSVSDLSSDLFASPARGRRVTLRGRVAAGGMADEDLMFRDPTGTVYLAGLSRRQALSVLDREVSAEGWFFRGSRPLLQLSRLEAPAADLTFRPRPRSLLWGLLLLLISLFL